MKEMNALPLIDRVMLQRDAVMFGTHVRRTPSYHSSNEACLVLPHYLTRMPVTAVYTARDRQALTELRRQEARLACQAILRAGHFRSLKEAIGDIGAGKEPWVRVNPWSVATMWNDRHATREMALGALDALLVIVKEQEDIQ